MLSIYSSQDIKLSKVDVSNNSKYDDLIHILYSQGIELTNSNIFDARSDAIDIDISEMNINNWYENPNTVNLAPMIMMNMTKQMQLMSNGMTDVFTIEGILD